MTNITLHEWHQSIDKKTHTQSVHSFICITLEEYYLRLLERKSTSQPELFFLSFFVKVHSQEYESFLKILDYIVAGT